MSALATDRVIHRLMREFIMAVNRLDNAEAREAEPRLQRDLLACARHAGGELERALECRGWTPPGRPQPDLRVVVSDVPSVPAGAASA